jgi:Protein of unknown function (DUF4233)
MSAARVPRPRRRRSATESLLSIALGLEAALVFFVTMTVFGLGILPAPVALGGGGAFFAVLVLATRLVRYDFGIWLGWVLQAAIIATGAILSLMYFIGAGFVAIWIYCFITGRRLDRRAATNTAEEPK